MRIDLGYKVNVAAIHIKILSKFHFLPLQNALKHCHDGRGFLSEAFMGISFKAKHAAKTWIRNQFAEFFKNGINGWKHCLGK